MAELTVDLAALRSNLELVERFCRTRRLALLWVTKVLQSRRDLLDALGPIPVTKIADVHAQNFSGLDPARFPERAVLRPRFGDTRLVAERATRVFLADPSLGQRLGECRQGDPLEVTLMVEAGDLRDGVPWSDVAGVLRRLAKIQGLRVTGLGTNLGCLAGAVPDSGSLATLAEGLRRARRETGLALEAGVSVGGTVFWDSLVEGAIPEEIQELRVGEAPLFGWNTSLGTALAGLNPGVFRLDLEVLELWTKAVSALPSGPSGYNAFGERPVQTLTGDRRRAVLDGGENLAPRRALHSLRPGVALVGETHDYTVVDCHEAGELAPGDLLGFRPSYEAVARCFLSPFVELKWRSV